MTTPPLPRASDQAAECAMCNDSGIVGFPPDQYEECPDCIKARAAIAHSAAQAPTLDAILNCYSPDDTVGDYQDKIRALWASAAQAPQGDTRQGTLPASPGETKQIVRDAVADALSGLYYCGRVWSAWGYGTMSESDFSRADEDDDIVENVTDVAMNAMTLALATPAAPTCTPADEQDDDLANRIAHLIQDNTALTWSKATDLADVVLAFARAAQDAGTAPVDAAFDFHAHLERQAEWSEKTFGPGPRTAGVCDHIRKELLEIEADPTDLREWIDVVILSLDGAWRCGGSPEQIIAGIVAKQAKNEGRTWPDWRTADPNKAIEHDRSADATPPAPVSTAAAPTCKPAQAAGQWVRCTPNLILAGVDCRHTPRRPGDGTYSHDHFIAHDPAPVAALEAPATEQQAATTASASEPPKMSIEEAREYLVKFMEQHFTDKTFHRYIRADRVDRNRLAGDFAWQMARALRMLDSRAPSRATDGQQGASRAALDEHVAFEHWFTGAGFSKYKDSMWAAWEARAAIARAPLPAQAGAVDLVVEVNRQLLLDRSRVGIVKYGAPLGEAGLPVLEWQFRIPPGTDYGSKEHIGAMKAEIADLRAQFARQSAPEGAPVCTACNGAGEYEHKGQDTRCRVCGGAGSTAGAGWKLVPVEPTPAMIAANGTCEIPEGAQMLEDDARTTWAAMLAAAPSNQSPAEEA